VKSKPKIAAASEKQFVVESAHAIDFADEQMPAVLCTPSLIWFLEHTAREAVLPCLESGESTVGINVEVSHLAATPVRSTVTCVARIIHVEGNQVSFQLEARDEIEVIAKGFHKLQVIRVDRFAARVQKKKSKPNVPG
jgi:fluoroacetyl-CoA thioesterase